MCRWRVPRDAILTPAQWADAKKIFLDILPQFFPQASQIIPSFVPLENDVRIRMDDMLQEEKGHNPAAAAIAPAAAAAVPAPAAAASALGTPAAGAANAPVLDMDGDQKEEQVEEAEKDKYIAWEANAWFSAEHGARFLNWYAQDSQPRTQWRQLQGTFPRLAVLARRFLCVLPSSAPTERIWSQFGHAIDNTSSTIDSTLASQIMFLRANKSLLDAVDI